MDSSLAGSIIALFCSVGVYCHTADPCTNHIIINDTTMDVSYTTENRHVFSIHSFNAWYRYTTTGKGLLTTSCPQGNQCGTASQAWMNDTPPAVSEGPKRINICIRRNTLCCDRQTNNVEMKNCTTFAVYKLLPLPHKSGYCFASAPSTPSTPLSSVLTSTATPQSENSELSSWKVAVIISGGIVIVLACPVAVFVLMVKRHYGCRKASVTDEANEDVYVRHFTENGQINANSRFPRDKLYDHNKLFMYESFPASVVNTHELAFV